MILDQGHQGDIRPPSPPPTPNIVFSILYCHDIKMGLFAGITLTLDNDVDGMEATEIGSMLFTRFVSGTRYEMESQS